MQLKFDKNKGGHIFFTRTLEIQIFHDPVKVSVIYLSPKLFESTLRLLTGLGPNFKNYLQRCQVKVYFT